MEQMTFDFIKPLASMESRPVSKLQKLWLMSKGLTAQNRRHAMFMIDESRYLASRKPEGFLVRPWL